MYASVYACRSIYIRVSSVSLTYKHLRLETNVSVPSSVSIQLQAIYCIIVQRRQGWGVGGGSSPLLFSLTGLCSVAEVISC